MRVRLRRLRDVSMCWRRLFQVRRCAGARKRRQHPHPYAKGENVTPTKAVLLCIAIAVFVEVWRAVAVARAQRLGFKQAPTEHDRTPTRRDG